MRRWLHFTVSGFFFFFSQKVSILPRRYGEAISKGLGDSLPLPSISSSMENWAEPATLGRLEPCAVWHPDNQVVNRVCGLQSSVGLSKNHCSSNLEL